MDELSHFLVGYGRWMEAKISAFCALETMGFDAIKADADCCAAVVAEEHYSKDHVEGEWCRRNGIIYVFYAGKIDASNSSLAKRKRERDKNDLRTAKCMLEMLHYHIKTELAA